MPITRKNQKFIDEYFVDLNASQAAIRAGYSEASARSIATELLAKPDIKAEVDKRMKASRMTADEVVNRLVLMSEGKIPTKWIETPSRTYDKPTVKREYDVKGATESLGKVHALFVDKSIVKIDNLDIVDDEDA